MRTAYMQQCIHSQSFTNADERRAAGSHDIRMYWAVDDGIRKRTESIYPNNSKSHSKHLAIGPEHLPLLTGHFERVEAALLLKADSTSTCHLLFPFP